MYGYGLTKVLGEIVTCPINKGTCPYDNEGRSMPVGKDVIFSECVTSGLVAQAGKIKSSGKTLKEAVEDFGTINPLGCLIGD